MGSKNKGLFGRAYNKAAAMTKPGGSDTLSREEKEALFYHLYGGRNTFKITSCQVCKEPTQDRDRTHQGVPAGIRVCGPCMYRK